MSDKDPSSILVLGLGNDLLKDDAIGIETVKRLRAVLDSSIECVETSTSGLGLIDYLVEHNKIIIIDGVFLERGKAGQVFEWGLNELGSVRACSPHYMGLREIREVTQWLNLPFPEEVKIIAVAIKDPFKIGEEMSPEVEGVIDDVINIVQKTISTWLKKEEKEVNTKCLMKQREIQNLIRILYLK